MQQKLRTYGIIPNDNICFPIGTILAVNKLYDVIDLSDKPEPGNLRKVSDLPAGIDRVILGITKTDPVDLIPGLKEKGIVKIWFHWNTETEKAVATCKVEGLWT